jgi:hypothetical protein
MMRCYEQVAPQPVSNAELCHSLLLLLLLLLTLLHCRLWDWMCGGAAEDSQAHAAAATAAADALPMSKSVDEPIGQADAGRPRDRQAARDQAVLVVDGGPAAAAPGGTLTVQNWKGRPPAMKVGYLLLLAVCVRIPALQEAELVAELLAHAALCCEGSKVVLHCSRPHACRRGLCVPEQVHTLVELGNAASTAAAAAAPALKSHRCCAIVLVTLSHWLSVSASAAQLQGFLYLREFAVLMLRQLLLPVHPTLTVQEYSALR